MASAAASARGRGTARGSTAEDATRVSGMMCRRAACRYSLECVGIVSAELRGLDVLKPWSQYLGGAPRILSSLSF